mgnify:CR=1 FL=1
MNAPRHKPRTGFFARHETFCPRYGWLKKGFDGVTGDPGVFDRDDAIEFLDHYGAGAKSLALNTIAYEWNSPGRVFQLSETDIGNRLERAASRMDGVVFIESYGNRQLQFEVDPLDLRDAALEVYYGQGGPK